MKVEKNQKCVMCGNSITGYGHNPYPVKKKGRCCDTCNVEVIQERLRQVVRFHKIIGREYKGDNE